MLNLIIIVISFDYKFISNRYILQPVVDKEDDTIYFISKTSVFQKPIVTVIVQSVSTPYTLYYRAYRVSIITT